MHECSNSLLIEITQFPEVNETTKNIQIENSLECKNMTLDMFSTIQKISFITKIPKTIKIPGSQNSLQLLLTKIETKPDLWSQSCAYRFYKRFGNKVRIKLEREIAKKRNITVEQNAD